MRLAAVLAAVLLAFGAMLLAGTDARSGTPSGFHSKAGGSLAELIVRVKSDKQKQKELNKDCGPGRVFVEGRCVKRENAEKREEKANPKPAPKPKMFCKTFPAGTGGALGCAGGHETCKKLANGDTQCCCPE